MDEEIRVKTCLAVVQDQNILLVLKKINDVEKPVWTLPGGRVRFGDSISSVAVRDFFEVTSLIAEITGVLDVNENILPDKPYHSLTITFFGTLLNQTTPMEFEDPKVKWFSIEELNQVEYQPEQPIRKALGFY